jgi:membrane protein implicated in regulation of membrane protease activity
VKLAIEVVSIIFALVAIALAVLSMRLNAKTERTYRRMEEQERKFYGR